MVITIIDFIFKAFELLLFVRIVLSWMPMIGWASAESNPIARLIHRVTEPFLRPIRQMIAGRWMYDYSPIIALIIAMILDRIIVSLLA